jgi:hypothetical protein
MIIEARAFLAGLSRSDYVRNMIDKSWGNRLAKAHRPYVPIASILLDISANLRELSSRQNFLEAHERMVLDACQKIENVLDRIIDKMALDQEVALDANHEEETFG